MELVRAPRRTKIAGMATVAKKLDVHVGDLVEIDDRRYDVVPNKQGGVTLEPAITLTVDDLAASLQARRLSAEEFDEVFGDLPGDGEG